MSGKVAPRVRSLPLIGSALKLARAGSAPKLHLYVDRQHQEYGPVYWENLGGASGTFVADPGAARKVFLAEGSYPQHIIPPPWLLYNQKYSCKRGLFFMDGEEWLKHRRIMNPIFFKKDLAKSLDHVYKAVTDQFLKTLQKFEGKEIQNLEQLLYRHSISFTVGNLLGTAYIKNEHSLEEDINFLGSIANNIFKSTAKLMNAPVKIVALLQLPLWKEFVRAVDASLIASQKLTEKMLQLELSDGILKELLKQNIKKDILESLILDLMLAAGDTTAFTTQWALYLLSQNPLAVDRLRQDNSFIRGILRETLRLYPSACFVSRKLHEDLNILNYTIPKGEWVMISLYTIGRLEHVYPEADKFQPERWIRDASGMLTGVKEPMAYFPFALGARSCIGRKLAEAQIYSTLTKVLSIYDIELLEKVDMELQMIPVPTKPIRLLLKINKTSSQGRIS